MIEVQKAIFARLIADAPLLALLTQSGQPVRYVFQNVIGAVGTLDFKNLGAVPGQLDSASARSRDSLWQFDYYGESGPEVEERLRVLLDGHRFAASGQVGGFSMHFSVEMPDTFDEDLKVIMKTVRYRAHAVPVGVAEV